jgi:hypothetical protein
LGSVNGFMAATNAKHFVIFLFPYSHGIIEKDYAIMQTCEVQGCFLPWPSLINLP